MKIFTHNVNEYIAVKLAICGELEKEALIETAPASPRAVWRSLKELSEMKVVIEHKYDDGRTFIRLSSVNSKDYLFGISPALPKQAKIVVNSDIKYNGSKMTRMRERLNYELYNSMLEAGIEINGFEIEKRSNDFGSSSKLKKTEGESIFSSGDILQTEKVAEHIKKPQQLFLTKKTIKKRNDNGELIRSGSHEARFSGALILDKQMYMAYALSSAAGTSWQVQTEFESANYICGCVQRHSPYFKESNRRIDPKCMLFYPSEKEAQAMILPGSVDRIRIDPCRIYKQSLIFPRLGLSKEMMSLLSIDGWDKKLVSVLFPDSVESEASDAELESGTDIYNFIGCDVNKIRYSMTRINSLDNDVVIIAEDWVIEGLKNRISKPNVNYVELSNDDIGVIARYM